MLKDLLLKNRSYRRFYQTTALSKEDLLALVDLTRYVASARNEQPLRYFLIYDKVGCDKMFPLLAWAGFLKDWGGPEDEERPTSYIIQMAPERRSSFADVDAGIAAQTILLGAVDKGFGGCLLGSVNRAKAKELFALPSDLDVMQVIALGKPAEVCVIEDMDGNDFEYWRDANDIHHVPKRKLKDIVINI